MLKNTSSGKFQHYNYFDGANHIGECMLLAPSEAVNIVELRGFEIYPQYRGKGLSYDLLGMIVDEARIYKFPIMSLKVKKDNAIAIKLYTSVGFIVKRDDANKAELEMELEL